MKKLLLITIITLWVATLLLYLVFPKTSIIYPTPQNVLFKENCKIINSLIVTFRHNNRLLPSTLDELYYYDGFPEGDGEYKITKISETECLFEAKFEDYKVFNVYLISNSKAREDKLFQGEYGDFVQICNTYKDAILIYQYNKGVFPKAEEILKGIYLENAENLLQFKITGGSVDYSNNKNASYHIKSNAVDDKGDALKSGYILIVAYE